MLLLPDQEAVADLIVDHSDVVRIHHFHRGQYRIFEYIKPIKPNP